MNYRLSTSVNRQLERLAYVIESEGKELSSFVGTLKTSNLKIGMFEATLRGLRDVRRFLKHEDILTIEVQNRHMAQWLSGQVEATGYEEYLTTVLDIIETVDCRYIITFTDNPVAKRYLTKSPTKQKLTGMMDI